MTALFLWRSVPRHQRHREQMDSQTLTSFRQQLFSWIEQRLATSHTPFRRVEQLPNLLCDSGYLSPDLVLWINRESCQAGGIILLPASKDEQWHQQACESARALGLSTYVLWESHGVSLWDTRQPDAPTERITLPGAHSVSPHDFEQVLDQLMTRLKLLSVAGALPREELSAQYFANLCLLTMEKALPGQAETSRMADDGTGPDTWATRVPRQKVWMTLWRLLFLLSREALPTSLQPHRLEDAMRYALAQVAPPASIALDVDESPLNEETAVGFYHLAKRLQQLGWPQEPERARQTTALLMQVAAPIFRVIQTDFPWPTDTADLTVNYVSPEEHTTGCFIAPRAYLAGRILLRQSIDHPDNFSGDTTVYNISVDSPPQTVIAHLTDDLTPLPAERQRDQLKLREVWPNHRFSLPAGTPAWLWEGMYLAGLTAADGNLHLLLGNNWSTTSGVEIFWSYLLKRYALRSCTQRDDGLTAFHFTSPRDEESSHLIRHEEPFILPGDFARTHSPGQLNLCLLADMNILHLWKEGTLQFSSMSESLTQQRVSDICLFLQTAIGRQIWQLQIGSELPADPAVAQQTISQTGLLLPSSDVLSAFSLLDWQPEQPWPDIERLNRVLHSCWGKLPEISELGTAPRDARARLTGRRKIREQIVAKVFQDGLPRFPEHYLQHHFRPTLHYYRIPAALEFHDRFFDRVFLKAADGSELELNDTATATALLLLSHMERPGVKLPTDPALTEELLHHYRSDLENLWKSVLRECRRHIQARRQAMNMARSIWKEANLPSLDTFTVLQQL